VAKSRVTVATIVMSNGDSTILLFYIVADLFAANSSIIGQFLMQKDSCFYGKNENTKFTADNCDPGLQAAQYMSDYSTDFVDLTTRTV
jgi:hypothetical protein